MAQVIDAKHRHQSYIRAAEILHQLRRYRLELVQKCHVMKKAFSPLRRTGFPNAPPPELTLGQGTSTMKTLASLVRHLAAVPPAVVLTPDVLPVARRSMVGQLPLEQDVEVRIP